MYDDSEEDTMNEFNECFDKGFDEGICVGVEVGEPGNTLSFDGVSPTSEPPFVALLH